MYDTAGDKHHFFFFFFDNLKNYIPKHKKKKKEKQTKEKKSKTNKYFCIHIENFIKLKTY